MDSTKIKRPAFWYYGGKWRLSSWIISQFPPHKCYVEPFAGAASVILRKEKSPIDVLNDINGDVINFFRVLRETPNALIRAIDMTPYSREEVYTACEPMPDADPVEQARRFYIRSVQERGFGGDMRASRNGWRYNVARSGNQRSKQLSAWDNTDHLYAIFNRLKQIQIENDSAFSVIPRFDTPRTLFYIDPPYLASTRAEKRTYATELTDADHRKLAELIHNSKGMFIVSGYPSDLYRELYADFKLLTAVARDGAQNIHTECLWVSPSAVQHVVSEEEQ